MCRSPSTWQANNARTTHEMLWNIKDFSCLKRMKWQADSCHYKGRSVNFTVIFCAVFTQALMSRSSRWVHIQAHWRHSEEMISKTHEAAIKNHNQNLSFEEPIFLVECDPTMTQQICQSRHVKHAFSTFPLTRNQNLKATKTLLHACLQWSALKQ